MPHEGTVHPKKLLKIYAHCKINRGRREERSLT